LAADADQRAEVSGATLDHPPSERVRCGAMRRLFRMTSTLSIDTWDTIYRVSYYFLMGSLFTGAIATAATFIASNRISADLTNRLELATKTAGEANVRAGDANERAAVLEADAAKARERTAALEVEAGRLRLALDATKAEANRIGQGLASRHLSPPQSALIASALRGQNFQVLVYVENTGDTEVVSYANEFIRALQAAGLVVAVNGAVRYPVPSGITVIDATDRNSSTIAGALEAAQIEFDFVQNASSQPIIRIGAKRSPF
jgi:hypothetical protein